MVLETGIINNSMVGSINRLSLIVQSVDRRLVTPSSAIIKNKGRPTTNANYTGNSWLPPTVADVVEMANSTLDIVDGLSENVEWIKTKVNRITFGTLEHYANEYGFYR